MIWGGGDMKTEERYAGELSHLSSAPSLSFPFSVVWIKLRAKKNILYNVKNIKNGSGSF